MPHPTSKPMMLKRLQTERRRLVDNLSRLTPEQMLQPGVVGDWSVKDILAHLADWESRMPQWMEAARRDQEVRAPAPDLTWKQVDLLNQRIYAAHRDQSLAEVLDYFHTTHAQFMQMVAEMPEDELLTRLRYAFLDGAAVNDWLVGYANHDLWAKTKIRQWLKQTNHAA